MTFTSHFINTVTKFQREDNITLIIKKKKKDKQLEIGYESDES